MVLRVYHILNFNWTDLFYRRRQLIIFRRVKKIIKTNSKLKESWGGGLKFIIKDSFQEPNR